MGSTATNSPVLSLKDLLDLLEKLEDRINKYWNFYSVAVFAVGAWIFSSQSAFGHLKAYLTAGALALFFLGNFMFITVTERRILAVEAEIRDVSSQHSFASVALPHLLARPIMRYRRQGSFVLHVIIDIAVVVLVLHKAS